MVIVGPTAVGKTEIAIRAAEQLGGEIISVNSRLFYRGMNIGTAKPTLEEQGRVPHHLIDVADPDEPWSLSVFQSAAKEAIEQTQMRGHLPILVGGTGQYVRAVTEGWEIPPQEPDPALRAALEHWAQDIGANGLHSRLAVLDPSAASLIDPRNMRRTVRALEVIFATGKRFSDQRQRKASPYSLLLIGLTRPRAELYERVDQRIEAMLAGGMIEEVQNLMEKGFAPGLPTLSAIGYREVGAYLRGEMTLEEAEAQMKRLTRRFVRHQGAWFSEKDPDIRWFRVGPDTVEEIVEYIRAGQGWILNNTADGSG